MVSEPRRRLDDLAGDVPEDRFVVDRQDADAEARPLLHGRRHLRPGATRQTALFTAST